ncbi:unnamed protein product [Ectocarpus sp. CCAP 1310/34]|nr:unnamed protein product [Ectocarpus sp. CCAP 1310/34]
MDIPDGFRLQASPPPTLDQSIVKRGVLVKLGLYWFGGVISRRSHPASRQEYDYRVILHCCDESTRSMKMPLESCSTDEDAAIGAWVLLEVNPKEGSGRRKRVTTPTVRLTELAT